MTNVNFYTEEEYVKEMDAPLSTVKTYHNTILVLNVTKDKLIEIGSEPFYNLILPYYNSASNVENSVIFVKPTMLVPRSFTQKNIKYILDI